MKRLWKICLAVLISLATCAVVAVAYLASGWYSKVPDLLQSIGSWFMAPPSSTVASYQNDNILFFGDNCVHCASVDTYIANNRVHDKISFVELEVFHHPENMNVLDDRAQNCGLDVKQIGVPIYWDNAGRQCIIGDVQIIAFFRKKLAS